MWKFPKRKPKKLTLRQVHELYLVLKHALPREDRELLIDQTEYILTHARPGTMLTSLKIMYRTLPRKLNGFTSATLFMRGLKETEFFGYVEFLQQLNARRNSHPKA